MSLFTMTTELTGMIPRMPYDYAATCVQRATLDAYRQNLWSFLTFEGNWTSPSWVTAGTVAVMQGSNQIQFDPLAATPAINAIGFSPSTVTQRQFRIGVGTIYNIWTYSAPSGTVNTSGSTVTWVSGADFTAGLGGAWNNLLIAVAGVTYVISAVTDATHLTVIGSLPTLSGANYQLGGIAKLDRLYQEATAQSSGYTIFQCYYAAPVQDFKAWDSIRDMVNYNDLYFHQTRAWIDIRDPQRTWYQIPTHIVPYQNDMNPASSTYGWPMFELWGPPTYTLTYQLYGHRKGFTTVNGVNTALATPSASLPMALGEDCIMAKARKYAYEWAEANPAPGVKRPPSYIILKRDADADYTRLYRDYRRDDRNTMNAWRTKFRVSRPYPNYEGSYNSISGIASPGAPGGA